MPKPWRPQARRSLATTNPRRCRVENIKLKRLYRLDGVKACEFCGWSAPPGILRDMACLILHHIVPLTFGGLLEDRKNTALLCPNHAALGDRIAFQSWSPYKYDGPRSREELFQALQALEDGRGKPRLLTTAPKAMEGFGRLQEP